MMHICTVATLCFPEKTVPRNYYYCVQDENSLCLCFKSMYRTLFVAIFTSTFIFSMSKSSHTYRNINISNRFDCSMVQYAIRYLDEILLLILVLSLLQGNRLNSDSGSSSVVLLTFHPGHPSHCVLMPLDHHQRLSCNNPRPESRSMCCCCCLNSV